MPGTIRSTSTGSDFTDPRGTRRRACREHGEPSPSRSRPGSRGVVVGDFTSQISTDFASSSILVKHSATYTAQYPGRVKVDATGPAC